MTEKEKMLRGEMYDATDAQLVKEQTRAALLCRKLNTVSPDEPQEIDETFCKLVHAEKGSVTVRPPFYVDYGSNITIGKGTYINFGCTILDVCKVEIGENVLIAPGVQIIAATHPTDPEERLTGKEYGKPVKIGNNVWLGAGVIVCPGVTIGKNTTIGAGSVVNKDIPENCIAVGNPCKVIRKLAP